MANIPLRHGQIKELPLGLTKTSIFPNRRERRSEKFGSRLFNNRKYTKGSKWFRRDTQIIDPNWIYSKDHAPELGEPKIIKHITFI